MLRGPICPQISPKWKIISAKTARNLPKLRSMAKVAQLRENVKVAQKLRSATSQFSGGTSTNFAITSVNVLIVAYYFLFRWPIIFNGIFVLLAVAVESFRL